MQMLGKLVISPLLKTLYRWLIRWITIHFYNRTVCFGHYVISNKFGNRWTNQVQVILDKYVKHVYETDTSEILSRFPSVAFTDIETRAYSLHEFETYIQHRLNGKSQINVNPLFQGNHSFSKEHCEQLSLSIVIPYCKHLRFFKENLYSLVHAIYKIPSIPIEVLVINDDPSTPSKELRRMIPGLLRERIRIINNTSQIGIARTLNRAIQKSKYHWLVHIDCDDLISPNSLKILSRRIRQFPFARYISSRMIDVDEFSKIIRVRLRSESFQDFSTKGMVAGHLKAIRRDLYYDIGMYDERYNGCQDYDFALRTILFEPILFIPDYLYRYRWHRQTQSVGNAIRQHRMSVFLQHLYRASVSFLDPTEKPPPVRIKFKGKDQSKWNHAFENWGACDKPLLLVQVESAAVYTNINRVLFVVEMMKKYYEMGELFRETQLSIKIPRT